MRVSVKVTKRVDIGRVTDKAARSYLEGAMYTLHANIAQPGIVPIDTGNLRASLAPGTGVTMVDPSPSPRWARVGTKVPYGRKLDEGPFHYAHGPSTGRPTKGWLSDAPERASAAINKMTGQFVDAIRAGWNG